MTKWDGKQNSMEIDNHCRMPSASSDDGLANRADEARKRDLEEKDAPEEFARREE